MARKNAKARFRELGAELRKKRLEAGLMVRQMAHRTGWSSVKVCRIESGQDELGLVDLVGYLGMMGIFREEAVPLIDLCRRAKEDRGYWLSEHGEWVADTLSTLIYHEATANSSVTYEPLVVPGYLQTENYARVLIGREEWHTTEEVAGAVKIRMSRQQILSTNSHTFYLHEQALRTMIGSLPVMYEQMIALVLAGGAANVRTRVIPGRVGERAYFGGPFHLFTYAKHRPLVYLDNIATGLFLEEEQYVRAYRELIPHLDDAALDAEESRAFLAALADEYDRGSAHVSQDVEEKHI